MHSIGKRHTVALGLFLGFAAVGLAQGTKPEVTPLPAPPPIKLPLTSLVPDAAIELGGDPGPDLLTGDTPLTMECQIATAPGTYKLAFPFILLAITVIGILGPSIRNLILVVGLANWAAYARVVRAETLAVRERPYVEAARSLGLAVRRVGTHPRR